MGHHAFLEEVPHVNRANNSGAEITTLPGIFFASVVILVVILLRRAFLVPNHGRARRQ